MKKWIFAFIFGLIAVILLSAALVMPWYYFKVETREGGEALYEYYFHEYTREAEDEEYTRSYSSEIFKDSKRVPVFNTTYYIMFFALIMTVLLLIFTFLISTKQSMMAKLAFIFGIVASVLALIAPYYLMTELPAAYYEEWDAQRGEFNLQDEDRSKQTEYFFGSEVEKTSGDSYKWGGGTGWVLSIAASVINSIAVIILIFIIKKPEEPSESKSEPKIPSKHRGIQRPPPKSRPPLKRSGYRR